MFTKNMNMPERIYFTERSLSITLKKMKYLCKLICDFAYHASKIKASKQVDQNFMDIFSQKNFINEFVLLCMARVNISTLERNRELENFIFLLS